MQIHAPLQQRKTVKIFTSTGKVLPSAPKGTLSVLFFVILLSNLRESANELRGKIYTRDKHMNRKKCSPKVFFTYFSESESLSCRYVNSKALLKIILEKLDSYSFGV